MENDAIRNRRVSSFPHRTNSSARPRSSCPKHSAMNHDGACLLLLLLPACRVGSWKALLELWPERDVYGARNVPAVERIWVSRACRWGWMFWRWVSYSHSIAVSPYRTNSDVVCQPAPCRFGLRGSVPSGGTRIESNPGPSFKYRRTQTHSSKDT